MNAKEKIFGKRLISTFAHEVGNPLGPLGYLIGKIQEGHVLTREEIEVMSETYERIEKALNKFRALAKNDFKGAVIHSDRLGLINEYKISSH